MSRFSGSSCSSHSPRQRGHISGRAIECMAEGAPTEGGGGRRCRGGAWGRGDGATNGATKQGKRGGVGAASIKHSSWAAVDKRTVGRTAECVCIQMVLVLWGVSGQKKSERKGCGGGAITAGEGGEKKNDAPSAGCSTKKGGESRRSRMHFFALGPGARVKEAFSCIDTVLARERGGRYTGKQGLWGAGGVWFLVGIYFGRSLLRRQKRVSLLLCKMVFPRGCR